MTRSSLIAFPLLMLPLALHAQQTQPAATPPATAPATQPKATMVFDFQDAPIDSVLNALSENFGLIIIKSEPIPGRITVVSRGEGGKGVSQAQAIEITNSLLLPLGFGIMETSESPEGRPIYRAATTSELKKSAPVGIFRN